MLIPTVLSCARDEVLDNDPIEGIENPAIYNDFWYAECSIMVAIYLYFVCLR